MQNIKNKKQQSFACGIIAFLKKMRYAEEWKFNNLQFLCFLWDGRLARPERAGSPAHPTRIIKIVSYLILIP